MRKLLFLGLVVLFSSCKKDRTCQCVTDVPIFDDTIEEFEIENETKKNAKIACEAKSGKNILDFPINCELKD